MYWVLSIISYNCSVYKYTNGNFSCKGNGGKQYDDGVRPICSYVPESLQTKEPCAVVVLQKWAKTLCKTRTYFTRTLSQMIKQNVSSILFTQVYSSLAIFRAKKNTLQFSLQNWERKEFRASVDWLHYGIHFNSGKRTVTIFIRKTMTLTS